ncbi:DUF3089 domain-containing protein [Phenylobacterium sp.]|uniref:DUF3089 domain-containing protein n=1 Tax=Phenylobacterium sp. TaxID=1871053 RepID=UPI002F3F5473
MSAIVILGVAFLVFRSDLIRYSLDPKTPYQTYRPPPAPDYSKRSAWFLLPTNPATPAASEPPADVFFISPTTYAGGHEWNAPIGAPRSDKIFRQVMAPNYAGPFVRIGRIFAPRYRQAGLYSLLTLRDDARDARKFGYVDVAAAFRYWRDNAGAERPFFIVGVEQGGTLAARLLAEEVAPNPALRARLAGAYLIETVVSATHPPLPPCARRDEAGCVAAWASVPESEIDRGRILLARALVWDTNGELQNLEGPALCFNPILGATTDEPAPARMHEGAANATGLEWGARPAFLARQVSARCEEGVLRVSSPKSASLRPSGSWTEQRMSPGFNLFYADLENDARARLAALTAR